MVKHLLSALLGISSLALVSTSAQATSLSVDTSTERLDSGDTWKINTLSMDHDLTIGIPFRIRGSLENEQRRLGSVDRAYLQAAFSLNEGTTLELGSAKGTGAVYGFRRQDHAMLYTSVGKVELATGLYQSRYVQSTTRRALLQARVYLPHGFTPLLNLSTSRSQSKNVGGSVGLGLEYENGPCTYSMSVSRGHEALDPAAPYVAQLSSHTTSAGLRCSLAKNVKLKLSASTTQAGILSRKGASGALVFDF